MHYNRFLRFKCSILITFDLKGQCIVELVILGDNYSYSPFLATWEEGFKWPQIILLHRQRHCSVNTLETILLTWFWCNVKAKAGCSKLASACCGTSVEDGQAGNKARIMSPSAERKQQAKSVIATPQNNLMTLCVCVCVCVYVFLCVCVCVNGTKGKQGDRQTEETAFEAALFGD